MTKVKRAAAIPLILSDPYFSIWSCSDHLNDSDTKNWTGKKQPIRGYITLENSTYCFMGYDPVIPKIPQIDLEVTATQTKYTFENDTIKFMITFSTDLDLNEPQKISEPVTVITTNVQTKEGKQAKITFTFSEEICRDSKEKERLNWGEIKSEKDKIAWMGKARQTPLDSSGDLINIDWGYLYLAATTDTKIKYEKDRELLIASFLADDQADTSILVAYDDVHAINYFGRPTNALWKEKYNGMYPLLHNYLLEVADRLQDCQKIDEKISQDALAAGGETLEFITVFSYRQSICAHKLIRDEEGEIIFLSKECSSNGCIGTVDISYPSVPLYLVYNPEFIKGMLRPIYKFEALPVWEFNFAPHDVGRYPYATGQVYGENIISGTKNWSNRGTRGTVFDYFQLPKGQKIYNEDQQMPIEESGNMLLMISATYLCDGDKKFFDEHVKTNIKWANYLSEFGQDPNNQLCTDDFAGHLAHNCNLSLKAITALGLFGKALIKSGKEIQGKTYTKKAKEMAKIWQKMAKSVGDHTPLAFDLPDSWSMKYNIVWDKLFQLDLFSDDIMKKEVNKYLAEEKEYGIPLDVRETYTKADWILWLAIFAENDKMKERMIAPVRHYIENTPDRVPFSDWYDAITAKKMNFINRSVVGATFMPILKSLLDSKNNQHTNR